MSFPAALRLGWGRLSCCLAGADPTGGTGLSLPAPDASGQWTLRLVLCQEGLGPVGWARDLDPRIPVELEGAAVPAGRPSPDQQALVKEGG
jgi:hypothetical protein